MRLLGCCAISALLAVATASGVAFADNATPGFNDSGRDQREALVVDREADDGSKGTLRWAITQSNTRPGSYKIVLQPPVGKSLVIRPRELLPPIVGPALLVGPWYGGNIPSSVIVDGSPLLDLTIMADEPGDPQACPGEDKGWGPNVRSLKNPALAVVDTRDVEITGFEIRNFCIGVLSLRSKNTNIHHMKFENNLGAAAVVLTGDDGKKGNPATFNTVAGASRDNIIEYSSFINNSDTIDVVRGDVNSTIRFNSLIIDGTGLAVPSSGVEVSDSDVGTLIEGNFFRGLADAVQINGSRTGPATTERSIFVLRNTFYGNVVAISVAGKQAFLMGNIIYGNRAGIGVRPNATANTMSQNLIYDNGRDFAYCSPGGSVAGVCLDRNWTTSRVAISLNYPLGTAQNDAASQCADRVPDCDTAQNHPIIERAAWEPAGIFAEGHLDSRSNRTYIIEFFVSKTSGPEGLGEAGEYVGALKVTTDNKGVGRFELPPTRSSSAVGWLGGEKHVYLTSTATSATTGATSELSAPILISLP
jgi:3-dehydroshikimate dehydratase